jgi:transformation/transcription domain-associated protein
VCLSATLNLCLPEADAAAAAAAAAAAGGGGGSTEAPGGTPLEKLATVLLEGKYPPMIRAQQSRVELGVPKTKTQLIAEKGVLTSLLTAVISAAGDEQLADMAVPFCRSICRHFAMLFAAGATAPPPAPLMSRPTPSPAAAAAAAAAAQQQQRASQQQVAAEGGGAAAPEGGEAAAAGADASAAAAAATAAAAAAAAQPPGMPQGLGELDVYLLLDALIEVLCDASPAKARAAVDALSVFITTLLQLSEAKRQYQAARAAAGGGGGGGASPAPAANAHASDRPSSQDGAAADKDGAAADKKQHHAADHGLPPVLDELMQRLLHCCWEGTWSARLGGMAALKLLLKKLPAAYLRAYGPQILRSLLAVVKCLPDHSTVELETAQATMVSLLDTCYCAQQIPAALLEAAEAQRAADEAAAAAAKEAADKAAAEKEQQQGTEDAADAGAAGGDNKAAAADGTDAAAAAGSDATPAAAGGGDAEMTDAEPPAAAPAAAGGEDAQKAAPDTTAPAAPAAAAAAAAAGGAAKPAAAAGGRSSGGGGKDAAPEAPLPGSKYATADAVKRARAKWASDAADVLLHTIFATNNSQRSRTAAISAIAHLSKLLDVHEGVWLGPVLCTLQPPLTKRRFVPVRVRSGLRVFVGRRHGMGPLRCCCCSCRAARASPPHVSLNRLLAVAAAPAAATSLPACLPACAPACTPCAACCARAARAERAARDGAGHSAGVGAAHRPRLLRRRPGDGVCRQGGAAADGEGGDPAHVAAGALRCVRVCVWLRACRHGLLQLLAPGVCCVPLSRCQPPP